MLTLKAPIQLHIAQGLTGNAEAFGERIRGNYGLLGAHFAPKDLLFLMTAPPELPEDLGGMTTLVQQQNTVDARSVTMDVVNNVVNRILLDGTEQFTYQDQVYITTVLNRLGITNVAQFMEQVRQLRVENESTVHMTKLYREELERILQRQAAGESAPALPLPAPREEVDAPQPSDPRVTMCMEVLNRLDTTNLYETVHAFQRSWTGGANTFRNQELKLSEQLRFSNAVSLAEIKQQIYQQPHLHLLHHMNLYEAGTVLEAPRDEEQVLSQAAAAALLTAVDNTVVEVLNRPQFRQEQWVRVQNALWQVAENSLSRFETYHSQTQVYADVSQQTDLAWNNYARELKEYQVLYQQMYPKAVTGPVPPARLPEGEGATMTHIPVDENGGEPVAGQNRIFQRTDREISFTEERTRELQRQLLREQLRTTEGFPGKPEVSGGDTVQLTYRNEVREGDRFQSQTHTEIYGPEGQRPPETARETAPEKESSGGAEPTDRETVLRQERERQSATQQLREIIQRQLRQGNEPSATAEGAVPMIPPLRDETEELSEEQPGRSLPEKTIEQEKHFTQEMTRELRQQLLREQLRTAEGFPGKADAPGGDTVQLTYRNEILEGDQFQSREQTEIYNAEDQRSPEAAQPAATERQLPGTAEPVDRETVLRQERERQLTVQRLRETIQRQLRQEARPAAMREGTAPQVPLLHRETEEPSAEQPGRILSEKTTEQEKHFTQETARELQRQTLRELLEREGQRPGAVAAPGDTLRLTHWEQTREGDLYQSWENETRISAGEVRRETAARQALPELRHLWPPRPSARSVTLHKEQTLWERSEHLRETRETAAPLPPVRERVETAMPWLELRERPAPQPSPAVPPVPMTLREAEEQAPEVLLEEMTRIDQHNRTVLQAVQEANRNQDTRLPAGPDIRRTMRDALRALEEPESVLREVLAVREQPPATVHPEFTPQEEALLRQAAPEDRAVYEAVLAYQKDPEGALARGLLRPGNMGALHAALQRAEQKDGALELEHPGEEALRQRELLREQSETVLEQFHRLPVRNRSVVRETEAPPPAVKIVHKQAAPDVTEELLEQLEEQRTRSTVHTETNEQVNRQQSHRTDVNQMERKVVAQTTEDITELVNRTLARQMRTISDQVYRQMEKRLQAERSRRGRL